MNYRIIRDGEAIELPIRVRRADDHKQVYAQGAFGGPLANYHFRIDFYQDIFPPQEFQDAGGQIQVESVAEIERRIVTSVYLPLPFLKELRNWLDGHVQGIEAEYGEIQLPKIEVAEEETKVTEA
ncbi:MAG: DUF3467 domain-containing protein [Pyrinomonadaceae bacterium]